MYDELFNSANVSMERFAKPARRFQSVVLDSMEKLAQQQFEAARTYADLGLKNLREGLSVKDVKGFQEYVQGQQAVVRDVTERLQDDAKAFVRIQEEFGNEVRELFEENVSEVSQKAGKAAEAAAKPAQAASQSSTRKTTS